RWFANSSAPTSRGRPGAPGGQRTSHHLQAGSAPKGRRGGRDGSILGEGQSKGAPRGADVPFALVRLSKKGHGHRASAENLIRRRLRPRAAARLRPGAVQTQTRPSVRAGPLHLLYRVGNQTPAPSGRMRVA